jgi:hypothetical protein
MAETIYLLDQIDQTSLKTDPQLSVAMTGAIAYYKLLTHRGQMPATRAIFRDGCYVATLNPKSATLTLDIQIRGRLFIWELKTNAFFLLQAINDSDAQHFFKLRDLHNQRKLVNQTFDYSNIDAKLSRRELELDQAQKVAEAAIVIIKSQLKTLLSADGQVSTTLEPQEAELLNHPTQHQMENVAKQQERLCYYTQQSEQATAFAEQLQGKMEQQIKEIQIRTRTSQELQQSLTDARAELLVDQSTYELTQKTYQRLLDEHRMHVAVYQQTCRVVGISHEVWEGKVNVTILEQIPIADLQVIVQNLRWDLEKAAQFVDDQEDELASQRWEIEKLQARIQQADEYEQIRLTAELANEQNCYHFLDQTLVGQRQILREREEVFKIHKALLLRYQSNSQSQKSDWLLLLRRMQIQQNQQKKDLQQLEQRLQGLQRETEETQGRISQLMAKQATIQRELVDLETALQGCKLEVAVYMERSRVYQEMLQAFQDNLSCQTPP